MNKTREFTGEFIGTFLLVFFGCGSVAVAVLYNFLVGIIQIAIIWGIIVMIAIYMTRHLSDAHFNPAVTCAMIVAGRMKPRKIPVYFAGQFLGAFAAAAVLYGLFSGSIAEFEAVNGIVRGSAQSVVTASMFGEFYPNPGAGIHASVSYANAFAAEAFGTFLLVLFILLLTEDENVGGPGVPFAPIFIGVGLAINISLLAPLSQGGFNPARDFAPRMFSILAGWGRAAMPDQSMGWLVIYMIGPVVGGAAAALLSRFVIKPMLRQSSESTDAEGCR